MARGRRHIVPNASHPDPHSVAVQFGQTLSAAVIVETVFAWPGFGSLLGRLRSSAATTGCAGAVTLLLVVAVILINLAADLLYARLDPRIRVGGGR